MKKYLQILTLLFIALSLTGAFYPPLQYFLALSWSGIKNFYLWQLLTYALFEPGSFSFALLIKLAFNIYIFWIFGLPLIEFARVKTFLSLYFGAILISGLATLPFQEVFASTTGPIYAILIAWMMVNQGSKLLLFFTLPFHAHWLILGIIGFTFFIQISNSEFVMATNIVVNVLYAYLFSIVAWKEQGPFRFLRPFERKILRLFEKKPVVQSKIFDIKSGAPVFDDDQFMDAMLEKISRMGEGSLTVEEKRRMQEISKKRAK